MATSENTITPRRHDLDNLRSFLTGLVVMHHTGAAYGGAGMGGLFKSGLFPAGFVSLPLWQFDAFAQTFFMGLFFWISGRVSAQSLHRLDRSGQSRGWFVRNKAKRLLLPAIAYTVTINPLVRVLCLPEWDIEAVKGCITNYFGLVNGIRGPVWYTATLFVFDTIAAATPMQQPNEQKSDLIRCRYKFLAQWGWIAVAATSFMVRRWYPVGKTLWPLNIQAGYATQYVFAYGMGSCSFKYGPQTFPGPFLPDEIDSPRKLALLSVSIISIFTLYITMMPKVLLGPDRWMKDAMQDISGGWNSTALAYATWNEFSFVLVGPVLMKYFYKWHNEPAASWIWQPRYSYAAFLFQYVVSIPVERMVDRLLLTNGREVPFWCQGSLFNAFGPVALTMTVGATNMAGSFVLGRFVVNSIVGMANIL